VALFLKKFNPVQFEWGFYFTSDNATSNFCCVRHPADHLSVLCSAIATDLIAIGFTGLTQRVAEFYSTLLQGYNILNINDYLMGVCPYRLNDYL
jgi:hypothetical protein